MRWQPRLHARTSTGIALASIIFAASFAAPAPAATPMTDAELEAHIAALKSIQIRLNSEGAQRRRMKQASWAREVLEAYRDGKPRPAHYLRAKKPVDDEGPESTLQRLRRALPSNTNAAQTIPANVRANDTAGDAVNAGQAESAIASLGQNILVAWNDGQGFNDGTDIQGYGYSTDGGATFTDGGNPPPGGGSWEWTSDPVVTVNENTGEFWYCGLINPTAASNGVGVMRGTFSGSNFNWDAPVAATSSSNFTNFHDKQWLVADSLTGNLYLSYTDFFAGGNAIRFRRSLDGGATWSAATQINGASASGRVQGSRPVVGPDGEVYVVWKEIGSGTGGLDFIKIRKSINNGQSFGIEIIAASFYDNFGSGAPGFNRERAVSFPSVAVDRTNGPNRGRVYVAYHESYNYYNDPIDVNSGVEEVEPNGTSGTANPFVVGNTVRGAMTNNDIDWFSFSATAGTDYIFWVDSIPDPLYSFRVFCSDGVQRLAFSGDLNTPAGGQGVFTWTAPTTDTYFLRLFWVSGAGTGGYRIRSAVGAISSEPARDHRDVFVSYSDTGLSWSTHRLVNDDGARYDNWLPEVAVASDGCPYVMWFDFRDSDSACAGLSHIYLSRSGDGGSTWVTNQQATDVLSDWTAKFSNIAPNQGDYSHMYAAADFMRWTWADARGTDPDIFVAGLDTRHSVTACQADTMVSPGDSFTAHVSVNNPNELFANNYNYTITDERGWPLAGGNLLVPADSDDDIDPLIAVPDTASEGPNEICVNVFNDKGTLVETCCFMIAVSATVGVGDGGPLAFGLMPIAPNPARGSARISFTLPSNANLKLRVYGLRGEVVRTLVDGEWGLGQHSIVWDGRDDRGNLVSPGTYFVRMEGLGEVANRRFVMVK